ncbi:DUF3093 domain-containing protein [Streptomyces sp. NPDC055078]
MHLYEERLSVPRSWWLLAQLAGVALGLVFLPYGPVAAVVAAAVAAIGGSVAAYVYGSVRIAVTPGTLLVGKHRIPVEELGLAEILDAHEAFEWRTRRADPHALLLIRGYVPTALRIELTSPRIPAPYLYLSTRRPMNLSTILAFTRG